MTKVPQRFWIGLVAVIIYMAVAGGLGQLLGVWFPTDDPVAEFTITHIPVLVPLIAAGVFFVWRAGWANDVYRTPASWETQPRRWWMLVFPVLLLAQPVILLAGASWGDWNLGVVALILLINLMVGVGEELYFRGILRASLIAHHGETLTLIVTSLLFGVAHSLGSAIAGYPPEFIVFQVSVAALTGVAYYGAFRATGRLWVAMVLHGLTDFGLRISSGNLDGASAEGVDPSPVSVTIQAILWALSLVLLISCIRQDLRTRRGKRAVTASAD